MDNTILTSIENAIRADYKYLRTIRDDVGIHEANTTISFYTRFIESIVNGLESIYTYHHAEEFVGRYLKRKRFFSLEETEFTAFAEDLTEQMIATGYASASSLVREQIVPRIIVTLKRWFYIVDGIDYPEFKKIKEVLSDIISYELTSLFVPSNLDTTLIHTYTNQFQTSLTNSSLIHHYATALGLPGHFANYLIYKNTFPTNWDHHLHKEEVLLLKPKLEELLTVKKPLNLSLPKQLQQKTEKYLQSQFKKDISLFRVYDQGYNTVVKELKGNFDALQKRDTLYQIAQRIADKLHSIPSFPSGAFDPESVLQYCAEKLKRWRVLLDTDNYDKTIPIMADDIVRVFYTQDLDKMVALLAREQSKNERLLLLIIAGTSLKFSNKFITWIIFQELFPEWEQFDNLEAARKLSPKVVATANTIQQTFRNWYKLPKNQYAALTKNFTSFYTVKKLFEVYYEQQQEMGNVEERIKELAQKRVKGEDLSAEDKIQKLVESAEKNPKRFSEDEFDEILYLALKTEMDAEKIPRLADLFQNSQVREKYQKLVFNRFDAYTFNRIMNTNYAGLGNLFGTKGFIILIEAYLVGSGIEHIIDYFVLGWVKTLWNIGTALIEPSFNIPLVADEMNHILDTTMNLSLTSFATGWALIDWPRTIMSVVIPIILMFLITSYNYMFYKLNRVPNREKSFKRLASSTERWISGKKHVTQLSRTRNFSIFFELFKASLLILETYLIIQLLYNLGFNPTQLALFFFLLATICLSAFQGNKLKDEVTLGQSEAISDTIRDFTFIPIIELGKFLGGQAKSINFIPWLVQTSVEPFYKNVISILQSFISFQREKKDEIL